MPRFDAVRSLSQFLLLDGSRAMTGPLDTTGVIIRGDRDVCLKAVNNSGRHTLRVFTGACVTERDIMCDEIWSNDWYSRGNPSYLRTFNQSTRAIKVQSHNGSTWVDLMTLGGSSDDITVHADMNVDAGKTLGLGSAAVLDADLAYFKIRVVAQSAEPTPQAGELMMWIDTDTSQYWLLYKWIIGGAKKVELT